MKKIINYIAQGQGIGLKFLALLALILGILGGIGTKVITSDGIPYAQQVADQLLPIKVVNGQIVEPLETYKVVHLRFSDDDNFYPVPIVLDTTSDVLDINLLEQGVYITKSFLYMINENEARTYKLEGDFDLVQKDYTDEFTSFINWTSFTIGTFIFAGLFVFYFLLVLLFSLVATLIASLLKINLDFNAKMRLSSLAVITTLIVFWGLRLIAGFHTNMWLSAVVIVALQIYLMKQLQHLSEPVNNENSLPETIVSQKSLKTEDTPVKKSKKPAPKKEAKKEKASSARSTKSAKKTTSKSKAVKKEVSKASVQKRAAKKPQA